MSSELFECCICYEPLRDNIHRTHCDHMFHKECLSTHLRLQKKTNIHQNCPLCRRDLAYLIPEKYLDVRVGDKVNIFLLDTHVKYYDVEVIEIGKTDEEEFVVANIKEDNYEYVFHFYLKNILFV